VNVHRNRAGDLVFDLLLAQIVQYEAEREQRQGDDQKSKHKLRKYRYVIDSSLYRYQDGPSFFSPQYTTLAIFIQDKKTVPANDGPVEFAFSKSQSFLKRAKQFAQIQALFRDSAGIASNISGGNSAFAHQQEPCGLSASCPHELLWPHSGHLPGPMVNASFPVIAVRLPYIIDKKRSCPISRVA